MCPVVGALPRMATRVCCCLHAFKIQMNSVCVFLCVCVGGVWKRAGVNTVSTRGTCHDRGNSKNKTPRWPTPSQTIHALWLGRSVLITTGSSDLIVLTLTLFCLFIKQGDSSKSKTKVWQNKNKGAKKTTKSKKKKLTKKKATPAPPKTKQANGNVAGNVRIQPRGN